MRLRLISTHGIAPPDRSTLDRGPKPTFDWLLVANLRVNEAFQRPLTRQSVTHIRRIAAEFDWIKFRTLTVAPLPAREGKPRRYSITDGQHRATAAALLGITAVPCVVIEADEKTQAAAFAAINSNVIRVHVLTAHRAATTAGEAAAVELNSACAEGGLEICPYPIMAGQMQAGQTLAVGTCIQALKRFGRETFVRALRCVTKTANNLPGAVNSRTIWALCEVAAAHGGLPDAQLISAFDRIEIEALDSDAAHEKPRHAGDTARGRLAAKLLLALDTVLKEAA